MGKIMAVRRMGYGTYRIVINVGTDNFPVPIGIADAELGGGTGAVLFEEIGSEPVDVKTMRGTDIMEFEWMAEFPRAFKEPIRLWGVMLTNGIREVLSHSEVVRLCRKKFATKTLDEYTRANKDNLCYQRGTSLGYHPISVVSTPP